jgi:RNA polymerase sigma-70 factor (ECF subfamily)
MLRQVDQLVRRTKKGDPTAVQTLVEGFWDNVCRFVIRLGASSNEAEDLAQEVFVKAFRALNTYTEGTNYRAWLLRIATNCFIDSLRRKISRSEVPVKEVELQHAAEGNPGTAATFQELERAVYHALQNLLEAERMVLVLRVYESFSHREIAGIVGKPESTVRWHLLEARKKLRKELSSFL